MSQLVRGAPGVYVRGLPSEPVLLPSAVTGFVGIAARGPLHRPEPIRTWDEYVTVFGNFVDYGFLPYEVFGFFRNGGTRCFVVRVADLTDHSAENVPHRCLVVDPLRAAANSASINDVNGDETLRIAAINEGRWGNGVRFAIQPASQRNMRLTTLVTAAVSGTDKVTVAEPFDLALDMDVRLAPPANPFGARPARVKSVDAVTGAVTLASALDADLTPGTVVLGQGFKLVVQLGERTEVFDNLSMAPTNARYFAAVVNGLDESLSYIERQARGSSILVRVTQVLDPNTQRSRFRPMKPALGQHTLSGGGDGFRYSAATLTDAVGKDSIRVVARATDNVDALGSNGNAIRLRARPFAMATALPVAAAADPVVVDNAAGLAAGDDLTLKTDPNAAASETHRIVSVGPDNTVTLDTGVAGLSHPYPLGAPMTVAGRFTLEVFQGAALEPAETHRNLSADPASPRYIGARLAADSRLVCGEGLDASHQPPVTAPDHDVTLTGGLDPGNVDFRWYTGYGSAGQYFAPPGGLAGRRYGLALLETVDEIDLVAVPDLAGQTLLPGNGPTEPDDLYLLAHRHVLYHAASLGDRMALLDTRPGIAPAAAAGLPQQLAEPGTAAFGALYYPWLTVAVAGRQRAVPPSGFVAGIIARADSEGGVGRAPANFALKDVVDLEVLLDQGDQDDLNPAGVNAARRFEAPAIELWGARTLSSDVAARYVNVRRLVIAVKKALRRTLLWTVFEPNGPGLRRRIRANLQSLMQTLVAGGATPAGAAAFFVQCDDENNPPEVTAAGQVVGTVGIALVAPAEFIVLNVKRTPDAVSVSEEAR